MPDEMTENTGWKPKERTAPMSDCQCMTSLRLATEVAKLKYEAKRIHKLGPVVEIRTSGDHCSDDCIFWRHRCLIGLKNIPTPATCPRPAPEGFKWRLCLVKTDD